MLLPMDEDRQEDHRTVFIRRSVVLLQRSLDAFARAQQSVLVAAGDEGAFYRTAREFEAAHQRFTAHLNSLADGEASSPLPAAWAHKSGSLPFVPACVAAAGTAARERYIAFFTDTALTPSTSRSYRSTIEHFMMWCQAQGIGSIALLDAASRPAGSIPCIAAD